MHRIPVSYSLNTLYSCTAFLLFINYIPCVYGTHNPHSPINHPTCQPPTLCPMSPPSYIFSHPASPSLSSLPFPSSFSFLVGMDLFCAKPFNYQDFETIILTRWGTKSMESISPATSRNPSLEKSPGTLTFLLYLLS